MKPVIVVCGMDFEARIAAGFGPNSRVVFGRERQSVADAVRGLIARGAAGLISFGTAGALRPGLVPGDVVIADIVTYRAGQAAAQIAGASAAKWQPDEAWLAQLRFALPTAHVGHFLAVDVPLASGKAAAGVACQAIAVDMESHWVAQLAAEAGLPFAVARAIIDDVETDIPSAALAGMRADGRTDTLAVVAALARRPAQLPALLRLGRDAGKARRALSAIAQAIGAAMPIPRGESHATA